MRRRGLLRTRPTPPEKPDPAIVEFTEDEIYLADGILRGVMDCEPVRDKLPKDAVAGIECLGKDSFVARVGYYLFENDEEMLEHYFARMAGRGRDTRRRQLLRRRRRRCLHPGR